MTTNVIPFPKRDDIHVMYSMVIDEAQKILDASLKLAIAAVEAQKMMLEAMRGR